MACDFSVERSNRTFFAGGASAPWIARGTLPVGSFLRAVSIDATLDDNPGGSWASDLNVLVDGLLQIGSDGGNPDWAKGQDSNVGATVIDTNTSGADFPATIDLNIAGLFLTNTWSDATWSGTVTSPMLAVRVTALSIAGESGGKDVRDLAQNLAQAPDTPVILRTAAARVVR